MPQEYAWWTLPSRSGAITAMAWSADGKDLAVVTSRGWLLIWSPAAPTSPLSSPRFCQRLGRTRLLTVAWARRGHSLAAGAENGALSRLHWTRGVSPVETRHLFAEAITHLAWSASPLDRCLVVAGPRVTVLDARGCQMHLHYPASILDAAWSSDGRTFALVGQDGLIEVWDAEQQQLTFSSTDLAGAQCLSWSPDGQRIAIGTRQGDLHFCHPRSGTLSPTPALARSPIHRLAWGAGSLVAASEQEVTLWDDAGAPRVLRTAPFIQALAFDPLGARLATAAPGGVSLETVGKGGVR